MAAAAAAAIKKRCDDHVERYRICLECGPMVLRVCPKAVSFA
jgi:hypothetical protein